MKRACIFFSLIAILTLDGMAAWAQKVNVDWDQTANFQGYGTYAWAKGTPAKNPLMDERIVAAVDKDLAAKGLRKVDAGTSPDLLVVYHAAVSSKTQLDTTNMGAYRWSGGSSTTTVKEIPVGELIVDIGDPKTQKMLWRGTATDTLSDNPQKVADKIDKSVDDMFKKFPPPKK